MNEVRLISEQAPASILAVTEMWLTDDLGCADVSSLDDSSPDDSSHGLFVRNSTQMVFHYLSEADFIK